MPKAAENRVTQASSERTLKGCQQIADFLGHPDAVAQRWASEGMPLRRECRFVVTPPVELNAWLGKESGKPVHVATDSDDLAAELSRGLSFVRNGKQAQPVKAQPKMLLSGNS